MALNGKRGKYLATVSMGEVGLGLSYAVDVTYSRAVLFSWLPVSIRTVGVMIVGLALLVGLAAFRSTDDRWDTIGWMAGMTPPLGLLVLWCVAGGKGVFDGDPHTSGWTPWAFGLIYACMAALIWQASDWPNPVNIIRAGDEER